MKRLKLFVFLLFLSWGSLAENDYEAVTKDDALTRLAFGSCADEEKDQPIWKSIEEFRPSMFLFLGDNVYGDKVNGRIVPKAKLLDSLKSAYLTAQTSQPEFIKFRSQTPYMATWDDHDYGRNDAGEDLFFKEEAKELFLNYWQVPDHDPRRSRPGVFYSKVFGSIGKRIQIIMLDTRFFRSKLIIKGSGVGGNGPYGPNRDESATLLGHEQWQWLEKKLEEHAEIRIIVSSIQIISDVDKWEKWGNFPHEKKRLYDLLKKKKITNIIFITGDRHFAAFYKDQLSQDQIIHEITASSLTNPFRSRESRDPKRINGIYRSINFGTAEFNWDEKLVTLAIRGLQGQSIAEHEIRLKLP